MNTTSNPVLNSAPLYLFNPVTNKTRVPLYSANCCAYGLKSRCCFRSLTWMVSPRSPISIDFSARSALPPTKKHTALHQHYCTTKPDYGQKSVKVQKKRIQLNPAIARKRAEARGCIGKLLHPLPHSAFHGEQSLVRIVAAMFQLQRRNHGKTFKRPIHRTCSIMPFTGEDKIWTINQERKRNPIQEYRQRGVRFDRTSFYRSRILLLDVKRGSTTRNLYLAVD